MKSKGKKVFPPKIAGTLNCTMSLQHTLSHLQEKKLEKVFTARKNANKMERNSKKNGGEERATDTWKAKNDDLN